MDTLRNIAIFTGFAGISGCVYLQIKAVDTIGKSSFFRAAFKVLRADPSMWFKSNYNTIDDKCNNYVDPSAGAVKLLGDPIKQLGFDLSHKENFCEGRRCQYHVRVKGPNDKGIENKKTYKINFGFDGSLIE